MTASSSASSIYTCCHPALAGLAQIALTLRTLGGLTTEEIARAFLTSPVAIAQRLVRAKAKICAGRRSGSAGWSPSSPATPRPAASSR